MAAQTNVTLDALAAQLAALTEQITALKSTPPPPPETAKRGPVLSTAAERIRQHVLSHGRATMPELQKELKLEKSAVHYYTQKLAADGRIVLAYEPHEASHSLVKVAWDPKLVSFAEPASTRGARTGTGG